MNSQNYPILCQTATTNQQRRKRSTIKPITNQATRLTTPTALTSSSETTHRDINIQLWTQKFVGASGNLDALLLDAFLPNETFARHAELFPNKLNNLRGRPIQVGAVTYIPYVVTNYVVCIYVYVCAVNFILLCTYL